jgi:23S rRNA pseudouridine1911/1915/1917 synthase
VSAQQPDPGPFAPKTVPYKLGGVRLDRAIHELFALPWAKARQAIQTGKVFVQGQVVLEIDHTVNRGDGLSIVQNAPRPSTAKRLAFEEEAIEFVDASVVVVRKPPGISTVPYGDETPEEQRSTLDALVREMLKHRFGSRGPGGRAPLGVVHRLDKDTSGLLVFTRTVEAKQHLADQFRKHTVHRRYLAVVHGKLDAARSYKSYFVENRGDGLRGSVLGHRRDGQLAITWVTPLEHLQGATLIACKLETGRTHQIRIHLSEAGHPLVGEQVYIRHRPGPFLEAPRILLHAAELGFEHPESGEQVFFRQPVPDDFRQAVEKLRLPGAKGSIDRYLERPEPEARGEARGEARNEARREDPIDAAAEEKRSRAALRSDIKRRQGRLVGPAPERFEEAEPEPAQRQPRESRPRHEKSPPREAPKGAAPKGAAPRGAAPKGAARHAKSPPREAPPREVPKGPARHAKSPPRESAPGAAESARDEPRRGPKPEAGPGRKLTPRAGRRS